MGSLTEEIKKSGFKKVYILFGEEEYLRQKAVKELIGAFAFEMPELNHSVFDGRAKVSDIITACETLPLMDERRLVQVKNFEPLFARKADDNESSAGKAEVSKLEEYLNILPDTTVLLFDTEGKADKRRKLFKIIEKTGMAKEYAKLKPQELTGFVRREAEAKGLVFTVETAEELIKRSGTDLFALAGELEKFAGIANGGRITKEDIAYYASRSLEYDVFSLHDLFMQGNAGAALALYNQVVEAEKSPFGVIGLIAMKFRLLLKARALIDAKYPMDSIISHMGVHPFAAKEAVKECRRFTAEELRSALKSLADLDYCLKSGQGGRYMAETVLLKAYKIISNL